MKLRWFFVFSVVLLIALGACQSSDSVSPPSGEAGEELTAEQPEGTELPYPAPNPVEQSNDAYPDPLYPEILDGSDATWQQAQEMITNGEIRQITLQGESTRVTMGLKDGRLLIVDVPSVSDVNNYISSCGEPCLTIIIIQE
ncbi:MAG: hypothetical protein U9R58_02390 [Chloroflexota bacterium]|nr:hypothetical protein [Chloroflexota bacterium]